ncbi:mannosyl-glycoprotein endo-beta-N-acetylglucosamidase [Dickeya fangzhongdai]|uniref:mannosyl-glycoprotein endo-beta-N-acetylglucosamidase n=1 Tax=Dickeya fangzhongdai TaxID=1778540 RepID=UPI0033075035
MKKNNTTRKQLFVVIKKTRSFAKKTEITTHSRQNTATANGTASSYPNAPSAGLDNIRLPAPQASLSGAPVPAASQPTPPAAPPAATVPPLPKFNKPHAEAAAAPSAPPAQPSTASVPQPSLPSPAPAPVAAASAAEPPAAQEPATPPFAPDFAAVGNQLNKLMSGMATPLSRLAGNLHGLTAQSLLKPAQSVTPKESKAIVPASNPTESISLPTAPAQKASTPISSGKTGTVQRALATGAAYKQGNIEGLDDAHTRALVASTAATESAGGKLDIRNSAGYIGRYQAGASWLAEAGLIAGGANAVIAAMKADGFTNEYKWGKSGGMTRFLKNKNNWKNGLDYEKYLSSAEVQDTAFKTNSDKAYKQLVKEGTITSKMSQDEIAGILKARHIGGLGGARKAAKGIEGAMDANGTSALKYKNDLAAGNVFIKNYQSPVDSTDANITTGYTPAKSTESQSNKDNPSTTKTKLMNPTSKLKKSIHQSSTSISSPNKTKKTSAIKPKSKDKKTTDRKNKEIEEIILKKSIETGKAYRAGNIKGLDDAHTRALITSVVATESSGGDLSVTNKAGYLGRYQAGAGWLIESGLLKITPEQLHNLMKKDGIDYKKSYEINGVTVSAEFMWATKNNNLTNLLKDPKTWKDGLNYEKYSNSAEIQDAAFKTVTDKLYAQLMKDKDIKEIILKMDQKQIAGLLKAGHIGGLGAAKKVAKKISANPDTNGTTPNDYSDDMQNKAFISPFLSPK